MALWEGSSFHPKVRILKQGMFRYLSQIAMFSSTNASPSQLLYSAKKTTTATFIHNWCSFSLSHDDLSKIAFPDLFPDSCLNL